MARPLASPSPSSGRDHAGAASFAL